MAHVEGSGTAPPTVAETSVTYWFGVTRSPREVNGRVIKISTICAPADTGAENDSEPMSSCPSAIPPRSSVASTTPFSRTLKNSGGTIEDATKRSDRRREIENAGRCRDVLQEASTLVGEVGASNIELRRILRSASSDVEHNDLGIRRTTKRPLVGCEQGPIREIAGREIAIPYQVC